ncbi:MAG: SMODS domain-containing nucleotidyltransferase [Rhodanobacter sp.]
MGLANWFETFCTDLQVDNSATIANRYGSLTMRLNNDFWNTVSATAHSLYAGSYGRNTAIRGVSDVDVIFELSWANDYIGNGQSALLQAVKSSIEKTYSRTSIRGDGQVIQINFLDMTFEVVPAFPHPDGTFTFPDANNGGAWRATNPRAEISAIRNRNVLCNYNLVPLCRMMRQWKNHWNVPIGGLLIDTLAYQFIDTWAHRGKSYLYYDFMCRDFFRFMADQSRTQGYWRAPGSGQLVYGGELFQWKATRCYNLSLEAIEYETATPKREWSAKQRWREIFGTRFPD